MSVTEQIEAIRIRTRNFTTTEGATFMGRPCVKDPAHVINGATVRYHATGRCRHCAMLRNQCNRERTRDERAEYQRAYYENRKRMPTRVIDALNVALLDYDAFKSGLASIDRDAPRDMRFMEQIADVLRDSHMYRVPAAQIARERGLKVARVYGLLKHPATDVRRRHVYGRWSECPMDRLIEDARTLWNAGATVDLIVRTLSSFYLVNADDVSAWLFGLPDDSDEAES